MIWDFIFRLVDKVLAYLPSPVPKLRPGPPPPNKAEVEEALAEARKRLS